MQQADDFLAESRALDALLTPLREDRFDSETGFKNWTFNHILRHLHVWNLAAQMSLTDEAAFTPFLGRVASAVQAGDLREFEANYLSGISGPDLLTLWRGGYENTAHSFAGADPKLRVIWAGPSMSARSSITARLMETWAHGQAIYDRLGTRRVNADYIGNIARLGINTFGWTYTVRGLPVPEAMPYVALILPSGEPLRFGDPGSADRIEGRAEYFCQVVTQCRNIADVNLKVTGPVATQWMSMAQCFAGGAQTPPPPGARRMDDAGLPE